MADDDDRALLDRPAGDGARPAGTVGGSSQPTPRLNGRRRWVAVALGALALGVATAGAFLLPRLQTEVPASPVELRTGSLELPQPGPGERCSSRGTSRVGI